MKSGAIPIHSPVYCVFDSRVPCWVARQWHGVIDYIQHTVWILETSKIILIILSVSDSQNQITRSFCGLHTIDWLLNVFVPLKDVSQYESERVSNSALLSESVIGVWYSDLRNTHFVLVDSRKHSKPSHKTDVHPSIAVLLFIAGMINNSQRIFSVRPVEIPIESSELKSLPIRSCLSPCSKHWARTFS